MRAKPNKQKLSELLIRSARATGKAYLIWDTLQRGLALRVERSGHRSFKAIYSRDGRPRWYHLGAADAIGLADARRLAARIMLRVAEGGDPFAERRAERTAGTFEELVARYLEHSRRKNKSWRQADALVRRHLLPRWARLRAADISRSDVRAAIARIDAPVLANQVLASASAIFSWAVREEACGVAANPCSGVERNATRSRERILSDAETASFWRAFDDAGLVAGSALKAILLLGQRPGEVARMRIEHVVDNWWNMPGEPAPALGWPGTKNGRAHRVWLPAAARALVDELADGRSAGHVFAGPRGRPIGDLDGAMRSICAALGAERATPHDLRRTHGSAVTAMGFGRDLMNRIQNHREGGIADVYDRHRYAEEIRRCMEAVAARIVRLAEGGDETTNVVTGKF